ncbi:conserved hypothetical protein [Magnetococcus marinus MC-1]|uniref:WalW protein n=1 Tax=Magnetococcus marinus (strain ATCC BAA-1437 / JCM 17883 / MC-1) TaxID=156889 RepID=A0LCV5_MAGMM|nr:polysaccharide deacetylase family protein [Magnetococcus marinus]ABK45798.1 conserved hypothetical protein [Magnetococcus marinus MC-1]
MHPSMRPVRLPTEHPPILQMVVDTEESFDWAAPFNREQIDVSHMQYVQRLQAIADQFGVQPIYVVDYAVAAQKAGYQPLKALLQAGRCHIGAHLHPWVNPPHREPVTPYNAYPGNLPEPLERAKLLALTETIALHFGVRPTLYKAGRYGFGPNTAAILGDLGYQVDLSPSPGFDQSADGGPDHRAYPCHPFSFAAGSKRLLCLPTTGGFMGGLHGLGGRLQPWLHTPWGRRLRLGGLLSRSGLLSRMRLSPEGYELGDLQRYSRWLWQRGERVFTLSLHSPSWSVGNTPYVQSEAQLQHLLTTVHDYCAFFMGSMQGCYRTPEQIKQLGHWHDQHGEA